MGRTHPPSHISFNGLAVTTHSPAPSSPLGDRNGEASTLLAEGVTDFQSALGGTPPQRLTMGPVQKNQSTSRTNFNSLK